MKQNAGFFKVTLAAICIAAIAAGSAWAATWQYVGTSGLTAATGNPAQDHRRIKFNSIATDWAGNVYVTAVRMYNYGGWNDNGTPADTSDDIFVPDNGGITIFRPDGSKVDVDLSPAPGPRGTGGVGGTPGGITKLVRAGDGNVYALQNWYEIDYRAYPLPYDTHAGCVTGSPSTVPGAIPDRILRVNSSGSVSVIMEYSPVTVDNCTNVYHANRIVGMDVGDDGNVYWTMNAADSYYKYHFFWRYRVGDGVIEEAPHADQHGITGFVNDGNSETHKMLDLIHVGKYADEPVTDWFTVLGMNGTHAWSADAMSWVDARGPTYSTNAANGKASPGWGRDWVTAMAYDAKNRKLWVGGRATTGTVYWTTWSDQLGGTTTWRVDLGGGNYGVRVANNLNKQITWRYGQTPWNSVAEGTLGAKFTVESLAANYYGTILFMHPVKYAPHVGIMIRDNGNGLRYYLYEMDDFGSEQLLYDIAPYVQNQTEEAYIYVKGGTLAAGSTDGTVKLYWGSSTTPVFTKTDANANGNNTDIGWGVSLYRPYGQTSYTQGTILYDWVALDKVDHAPGAAWPTGSAASGGIINGFLDGSVPPADFSQSSIMSRWDGDPYLATDALYDSPFYPNQTGIGSNISWHANGNNPSDSNERNGRYWVSAITIHPANGDAWMAWNGINAAYGAWLAYPQSATPYAALGEVFRMGKDSIAGPDGSEGVPQAAHPNAGKAANPSQVVALYTATKWIYAETVDLVTGEYNLFRTPTGGCNTPAMDVDDDNDVDLVDFGWFQACFNGPNRAWKSSEAICTCLDGDDDGDVDLVDFGVFQTCFNGPNRAPRCL
mgnify:CR=1 FL=1